MKRPEYIVRVEEDGAVHYMPPIDYRTEYGFADPHLARRCSRDHAEVLATYAFILQPEARYTIVDRDAEIAEYLKKHP